MSRFKEIFIGDGERYDYCAMCIPNIPFITTSNTRSEEEEGEEENNNNNKKNKINFYTKDEPMPLLMSAIMGLQHAFSMVGGVITVPYVVFRFTICFSCVDLQQYAIAAALISSGICTCINVSKIPIPYSDRIFERKLYLGSGVLSVMGTSFTFLPIYEIGIRQQIDNDGIDPEIAYGNMLGTGMICGILEIIISMLPLRYIIKKLFSPIVTSITVMLIGIALTGTGMKYWGGGVVCADMIWKQHNQLIDVTTDAELVSQIPSPICTNGQVSLGYGSSQFIGLGFVVMCTLVIIELFGSVFMKNCNVIISLLMGYLIAGISDYNGDHYVDKSRIEDAETFTFLWFERFPIGFYGPAVIPLLIAYIVTSVETVGDITAVYEASEIDTTNDDIQDVYSESIQGGLFADGIGSILSGLFTTMPNTTFSQNNGVISLTKCASRRAGYACGIWLILMGIFSKISGIITSIPDCVLGGMTIFLFANVLVSGISLAGTTIDLHSRRNKLILALSLAIGVGVTIHPYAFQDMRGSSYSANFWKCTTCNDTMKGIRNGVSIFLSTGYCIGTVIAMILNAILPQDPIIERFKDIQKNDHDEDNNNNNNNNKQDHDVDDFDSSDNVKELDDDDDHNNNDNDDK